MAADHERSLTLQELARRSLTLRVETDARGKSDSTRRVKLIRRPLQIQRQQFRQQLVIRNVRRPTVGGEHGFVEAFVDVVQPRGAFVVEVGQRAFLEFRCTVGVLGYESRIAQGYKDLSSLGVLNRIAG